MGMQMDSPLKRTSQLVPVRREENQGIKWRTSSFDLAGVQRGARPSLNMGHARHHGGDGEKQKWSLVTRSRV